MPDIRADFHQPAWLNPSPSDWVASPQPGVSRVLLDRVGDEVAVATSLVRYAAGSHFPTHNHALGEEYVVLEGEFADEHGRYPPGTYVRNPPGSSHAPFSRPGCVIWVKLRQFDPADDVGLVTNLELAPPATGSASRLLHEHDGERVQVLAVAAGAVLELPATDTVQEVLVLEGEVSWQGEALGRHGWLRVPAGQGLTLTVAAAARLLHKTRPAFALPQGAEG